MNMTVRKKILVCDDDKRQRESLQSILKYDYDVSTALNGQDALDYLTLDPTFDLVLLDNNMPEMTGLEALPIIKKKFPHIKVVMISGDNIKNSSLELGALEFLSKPVDLKEMMEMLKGHLL